MDGAVGVTYAGQSLNDRFIVIGVDRPLPEFKVASTEIEGIDGEVFDSQTIGRRTCTVKLVSKANHGRDLQYTARELMGILNGGVGKELGFDDEMDADGNRLWRIAYPLGVPTHKEYRGAIVWEVTFVQLDPFLYGKRRSLILTGGYLSTVKIGGNAETWLRAEANPSGSSYFVQKFGSQGNVYVDGPFSGGKVTIDFERQVVQMEGNVNAKGLASYTRFFSVRGTERLTASHRTTITWRERWL